MLSLYFLWYKASLPLPIAETGKWRLRAIKQPAQGKARMPCLCPWQHALLPLSLRSSHPFPRCSVAVGVSPLSQPHTYTAHVLVGMSVSNPILQMVELRP